jgi:hypothetical protein
MQEGRDLGWISPGAFGRTVPRHARILTHGCVIRNVGAQVSVGESLVAAW